jgi:5-methylcytosine-specific restriction endonuclease McrA
MKMKKERTRNAKTLTESMYWSMIRSALRNAFKYWKPGQIALENVSRKIGKTKEYQCNHCADWFKRKEVQIDHIEECGSLKSFDDIQPFIEKLTIEDVNGFQILCKECHNIKTKENKSK